MFNKMLKIISNLTNKKKLSCFLVVFLTACSTNNITEETSTIEQELVQTLALNNNLNTRKIHTITKQLVKTQHWEKAFLGYQRLCQQSLSNQRKYCTLMWASAQQSNNNDILFEAAATNYALNKNAYWLEQSQHYAQNKVQVLILKTLQSIPLVKHQLMALESFPKHYAQALFLKGRSENSVTFLTQARKVFIEDRNWQKVADSLLLSAQIVLTSEDKSKASFYFNEAIIYYDLANANDKLDVAINWGKMHGITW